MASSSTDYQGPVPVDVDRVQDAKGNGKNGKNDPEKGKGKDAKGKGKNEKGDQKGKEGDRKGKGKGKDIKSKVWGANVYTRVAKDCWRNNIRQVASDQAH